MAFKNTLHKGQVRNVIFQDGDEYVGAALEFNIVEVGDSPQEVMLLLDDAIKGYLESAQKNKLSISVLNQEIEPEYEELWHAGQKATNRKVYSATSQSIAALTAA
jgi:predicted RNase H-like HicB family nuclease